MRYILYHANCRDGVAAMQVARKYFEEQNRLNTELSDVTCIPVQYGQPCPILEVVTPTDLILILDFSYPKDVLLQLYEKVNGSIRVFDHHKTAQEDLADLPFATFDMNSSGATLTWKHLFPGKRCPKVLTYVEDRDLWKWRHKDSKAFNEGLTSILPDTKSNSWEWQRLLEKNEAIEDRVLQRGEALLRQMQDAVAEALKKVHVMTYGRHKVGIFNSACYASEIGEAICTSTHLGVDYAIVYCPMDDDRVSLSFRSRGEFDVSAIARTFGGGGHKNAAGAYVSAITLKRRLLEGDIGD